MHCNVTQSTTPCSWSRNKNKEHVTSIWGWARLSPVLSLTCPKNSPLSPKPPWGGKVYHQY
jgi:hypothetical protein